MVKRPLILAINNQKNGFLIKHTVEQENFANQGLEELFSFKKSPCLSKSGY